MLTAGLILAIMVLPFITSISRDVFDAGSSRSQGSGLRHWLHHLGKYSAKWCFLIRESASLAA